MRAILLAVAAALWMTSGAQARVIQFDYISNDKYVQCTGCEADYVTGRLVLDLWIRYKTVDTFFSVWDSITDPDPHNLPSDREYGGSILSANFAGLDFDDPALTYRGIWFAWRDNGLGDLAFGVEYFIRTADFTFRTTLNPGKLSYPVETIPLPATAPLLIGAVGMAAMIRRRRGNR